MSSRTGTLTPYPLRRLACAAAAFSLSVCALAAGAAPAGARSGRPPLDPAAGASGQVEFHKWTTQTDFASGTANGVGEPAGDRTGIDLTGAAGSLVYKDAYLHTKKTYDYATWTSPAHQLAFGATELVSSWSAETPAGTWLKVELNATMEDGAQTGWLDMGHWAALDTDIARTSVSPSAAPYGQVDTDTFFASAGHAVHAYQLRTTLYRLTGSTATPRLWQLAAFASLVPARSSVPASPLGGAEGIEQLIKAGVPVAISVAFDNGELTGSGYGTAGHLMVVVGFTPTGDFIVNDPYSPSDAQVRHVYPRSQLENIWLRTYWTRADGLTGHGSGGVAYVITPHTTALPPVLDPTNPTW